MTSMQEAGERIGCTQALPFRLKQLGNQRCLEYDQPALVGHRQTMSVYMLYDCTPPFEQIVATMTMYRELEASVSGLKAERDELQGELTKLTGQHERLQKRCAEFERRANGGKRE